MSIALVGTVVLALIAVTSWTILLTPYGEIAWRAMFWIGILPALLVLWDPLRR